MLVPIVDLDVPVPAERRSWIPLEPGYDVARSPIAPSHATDLSRPPTWCRVLARGEAVQPFERPALTHFAICPARQRPTEGPHDDDDDVHDDAR